MNTLYENLKILGDKLRNEGRIEDAGIVYAAMIHAADTPAPAQVEQRLYKIGDAVLFTDYRRYHD